MESAPAVDANTHVAAEQVAAGASVLAGVGLQAALVHILGAVLTCREAGGGADVKIGECEHVVFYSTT